MVSPKLSLNFPNPNYQMAPLKPAAALGCTEISYNIPSLLECITLSMRKWAIEQSIPLHELELSCKIDWLALSMSSVTKNHFFVS